MTFAKMGANWLSSLRTGLNTANDRDQIAVSIFCFGIGVALAAGLHSLLVEPQGYEFVHSGITGNTAFKWFVGNKEYSYIAAGAVIAALISRVFSWLTRLFNSWVYGILNELPLISFCVALAVFLQNPKPILFRCIAALTIVSLACIGSYYLRRFVTWSKSKWDSVVTKVIQDSPSNSSRLAADSDDPVESWEDDLLDRPPLVDLLVTKLLDLKTPVVILDGRFGAGKSSVLNLLRLRLKNKAIVVSFRAWLPDSERTLTDFLVSDIVAECRKRFIVPGLARSARRFVNAIAKSVPHLLGLTEFLPAGTQLDIVNELKSSVRRIPMRVVVLIDEVDRMQGAEILALLKLLRGIDGLQNLSFVCACDKDVVIRKVGHAEDEWDAREYFEKFFLDVVPLSEPTSETLEMAGISRIVRTLKACDSFATDLDEPAFQSDLHELWPNCFAYFCCNLRKIGIVVNDLHGAATLLRREVNHTDLVLITLLHRMNPQVHALVANQHRILTGGFNDIRRAELLLDEDRSSRETKFMEEIIKHCKSEEEKKSTHAILMELFPLFSKLSGKRMPQPTGQEGFNNSVRISDPLMFGAYFRNEIPKDVFSAVRFEEFLESIEGAKGQEEVSRPLGALLTSMEKGGSKREDFIQKIELSIHRLDSTTARWLALTVMQFADHFDYDLVFFLSGESEYAFQVVCETLSKIADTERVDFLRTCISETSDDGMAFGLIDRLTDYGDPTQHSKKLETIPLRAIWDAFATRMRSKYNSEVDVSNSDLLRTSSLNAFLLWGWNELSTRGIPVKQSDREMRDDFWVKYIGNDKRRLARVFHEFFMPRMRYDEDPTPFVEKMIPLRLLSQMNMEARYAIDLTKEEAASLQRLDRLLKGDYKDGAPIKDWQIQ